MTGDDPVPRGIVLNLEETFRVLGFLEDSKSELQRANIAPGPRDELATVIRQLHGKLGLDQGGFA